MTSQFRSISEIVRYIAEYGDRVAAAPAGETIYDGIQHHAAGNVGDAIRVAANGDIVLVHETGSDVAEWATSYTLLINDGENEYGNGNPQIVSAVRALVAAPRTTKHSAMVRCSCGHSVPQAQVMSASLGTACPDCYDRLS